MDGIIDCPSPNFDERDRPVSLIVLHYTGMTDAASAIQRLRDPEAKVSCHYLVAEDGQVLRMVAEDKRAWHAGRSYWRGMTALNGCSIGIEIVNPGHEFGYRPFPDEQIDALIPLVADIKERYGITRGNIVGGLLFGVGWSMAGMCPGPIFVNIGEGKLYAIAALAGALTGTALFGAVYPRIQRAMRLPPVQVGTGE